MNGNRDNGFQSRNLKQWARIQGCWVLSMPQHRDKHMRIPAAIRIPRKDAFVPPYLEDTEHPIDDDRWECSPVIHQLVVWSSSSVRVSGSGRAWIRNSLL